MKGMAVQSLLEKNKTKNNVINILQNSQEIFLFALSKDLSQ